MSKNVFIIILFILLLSSQVNAGVADQPDCNPNNVSDRLFSDCGKNGKLLTATKNVFELVPPVDILAAVTWQDGGSIDVSLADNSGKIFCFILKADLSKPDDWPRPVEIWETSSRHESTKLSLGGKEEKTLLELLEQWSKNNDSGKTVDESGEPVGQDIDEIIKVLISR